MTTHNKNKSRPYTNWPPNPSSKIPNCHRFPMQMFVAESTRLRKKLIRLQAVSITLSYRLFLLIKLRKSKPNSRKSNSKLELEEFLAQTKSLSKLEDKSRSNSILLRNPKKKGKKRKKKIFTILGNNTHNSITHSQSLASQKLKSPQP